MDTEKKIAIAFWLNLGFSLFECVGGILTGSVAILSDALHDLGDAVSIGLSLLLERKSKGRADERYTYGYARYSVLGSLISTTILLVGSVIVLLRAFHRLFSPAPIHPDSMILFAVVGVCVNAGAALFTRSGHSLNQKAVNLHLLEDVLGWLAVLAGAFIMRFTGLTVIDPLLSIVISFFLLIPAIQTLKTVLDLFLMKAPKEIGTTALIELVSQVDGVSDVHHVHLWSMDGQHHYATMHLVTNGELHAIKRTVREVLSAHGIACVTIESEAEGEPCHQVHCHTDAPSVGCHHHHHH